MRVSDNYFTEKYQFDVFKKNSLTQLLQQAEADAIGIAISDGVMYIYAVDVAYHEAGLNYGSKKETVERVVKKYIRTAMCVLGYFNTTHGELVFSSPKINNTILEYIISCVNDLNKLFQDNAFEFSARVFANEDFNEHVLNPILIASDGVSDTSELFLRSYQLVKMFETNRPVRNASNRSTVRSDEASADALSELKVGKIAQTLLRAVLERGDVSDDEVTLLQEKEYSKQAFGIDFQLLISADAERDSMRYYVTPLEIRDKRYFLCSQWFEVPANNDRPFLLKWLEEHGGLKTD